MATVVSQTLAAGLVIYHLYNMDARYCLRFKKITLDLPLAREIFRIGIPAAIQTIVITLSNIVVQTNINELGVNSIAAYAAYFKVENVIYLSITGTWAGLLHLYQPERGRWQNYAQQTRNCHFHLFRPCGYCSKHQPGAVFCRFCFRYVYRRRRGYCYRQQHCLCYYAVLLFICFPRVLASSIRGSGSTLPTMIIILVNMCVIRIGVLKLIMYFNPTADGVAWVYPITWVFTVACLYWYYRSERWNPVKVLARPDV